MPLDGHSYLVSQGWGGKGTGLREGAISRPLAIAQKKNLAGLGKDRDEAFPFWDHLFSAAAKSIVVKCLSDDEDNTDSSSSNEVAIKRTSTGIFSTRRPVEGTPATSGDVTPDDSSATPRLSLMASAKRDAARRGLYSRFFKGPVLGPESIAEEERRLAAMVTEAFAKQNPGVENVKVTEHIEVRTASEKVSVDLEVSKSSRKKRKTKATEESESDGESEAARRERKQQRREKKNAKKGEKERTKESDKISKKSKKSKSAHKSEEDEEPGPSHPGPSHPTQHAEDSDSERERKAERRRRKEEKKRLKALRKGETATDSDVLREEKPHRSKSESKNKKREKKSGSQSSTTKAEETTTNLDTEEKRNSKKRKRKRTYTSTDED